MKKITFIFTGLLTVLLASCGSELETDSSSEIVAEVVTESDSILLSFVFSGCNRVNREDLQDTMATNTSSANVYALQRIFDEVVNEYKKPDLFFFMGDMVYAESTTELLNEELEAWVAQYKDPLFSEINKSGIEMVAIPGNHEMLSWADHSVPGHDEWPLKGATDIWMKYMADFMPIDRDFIRGVDSVNNQMTFSFTRGNVGFVLMNTDTYNEPTTENPYGLEGQIPTNWIIEKVNEYKNNASIDHVFVLGHKPYYVAGVPETGHKGLPEGPTLWPALEDANVNAMLSAHVHDYQRMQPGDKGTYQIIAGNGGSKGAAKFFGYSLINIWSNGDVELLTKGFDVGAPYYSSVPENPTLLRDSTILTTEKNGNPYIN